MQQNLSIKRLLFDLIRSLTNNPKGSVLDFGRGSRARSCSFSNALEFRKRVCLDTSPELSKINSNHWFEDARLNLQRRCSKKHKKAEDAMLRS